MKNLLFAAYDMNMGGIETSLVTLLNYLVNNYTITLVLENKEGTLLKKLDSRIKIVEYKPCNLKNLLLRKVINGLKRLCFIVKYKNKFDFSASYATYSKASSFVARTASVNTALWGHADYLTLFNNNKEKMKTFFNDLHYDEFNKIIFVAKSACKTFCDVFPEQKYKVEYINNLRNYEEIEKLSKQPIDEVKKVYTFVNISRHDELQKKITRIIESAKLLKEDKKDFKIIFVGNGKDTNTYKEMVKRYGLLDKIEFVGQKENPYPYMELADSIILSSDYEGYPSVFVEAMILNKPIITTDVSDAKEDVDGKFGKVVKKDVESIYNAMKDFIENGYEIKKKFDKQKYNEEILEKIEKIINIKDI